MKNNKLKIASILFGFISLISVLSCSSVAPSRLTLKFIDSLESVEGLASQIVVGETSGEEVLEILGPPFSTRKDGSGFFQFTYLWRITPIRTLVEWGDEISFDPLQSNLKAGDSFYRLSSDKVQLFVAVNLNGVVVQA